MDTRKIYLPALCFLLLFSFSTPDRDWGLRKDKNGIKVYSRSIEGTPIKELRAKMIVHSSLSAILKLMMDIPACTSWVYRCKEAYPLKRLSPHEEYYYEQTSAPWPISNRDLIIHSHWVQDELSKKIIVSAEGVADYLPEKEGVVRIRNFKSSWILTPLPGKMVDVEYIISVDPAGLIPAWLVNLASSEGPYQSNLEMEKMLDDPKYLNSEGIVKEL